MTSTTTAGFTLEPVFTAPGAHGFDGVEFTLRDALIQSGSGKTVFEQKDCEVPTSWSQTRDQHRGEQVFPWGAWHPGT